MILKQVLRRVAGWLRGTTPERPRSAPTPAPTPSDRLTVRASHGPPQSREEIAPILRRLQQMDSLLDILWNAQAVMLAKGSYSETGKLIPPTYEGRWQIIRHQTDNSHPERGDFAVICTLTEPIRFEGILCLTKDGPYAPVGDWVLELMRSADAANVAQFKRIRDKLWAQHDKLEADADKIDEAEAREGLSHVLFDVNYAGGVGRFPGKGADFGATAASAGSRIIQP